MEISLAVPEEPVELSVILPVYNEEESLVGVYSEIKAVLEAAGLDYELVFIDDGSTDTTWRVLEAITAEDPHVRALRHRRNFGKASALANGFSVARGNIMATTDADLQYDPRDILRLVQRIEDGFDVVCANKVVRRDPISKRLPSKFFNFFVRRVTGIELHDFNAGLKAYRHQAALDLVRYGYGELHRFFAVISARKGYAVSEVAVESRPRENGASKYGMERYLRGALDFMTALFLSDYMERPLHLLGGAGVALTVAGTGVLSYLGALGFIQGVSIGGRPLLMVGVLFIMTGIQLMVAGLLAEMIHNLEHGNGGRVKVAQVIRVDRRSSLSLTPGVMVDRRHRRQMGPDGEPRLAPEVSPAPAAEAQERITRSSG